MDRQVVNGQNDPRRTTYCRYAHVHLRVHFLELMMNSLRSGELDHAYAKDHKRRMSGRNCYGPLALEPAVSA
jgi:hypothetical protein